MRGGGHGVAAKRVVKGNVVRNKVLPEKPKRAMARREARSGDDADRWLDPYQVSVRIKCLAPEAGPIPPFLAAEPYQACGT